MSERRMIDVNMAELERQMLFHELFGGNPRDFVVETEAHHTEPHFVPPALTQEDIDEARRFRRGVRNRQAEAQKPRPESVLPPQPTRQLLRQMMRLAQKGRRL